MARLYLLLLTTACFLLGTCSLGARDTEGDADSVFVTRQSALAVLRRQRRYNSGGFEEYQKDNLERECMEETCNMEEAREVFENDEKTMEFWVGYIDGNQCDSSPCLNRGSCKDGVDEYFCFCSPNFRGKNCEIKIGKDCSVNNGGCSHFCVTKEEGDVCLCAAGYRLGTDKSSCEPTGEHDERDHRVAERFIHPSYDARKSRYNHDIALLKLASPVELSSHRIPICLGPKDFTETLMRDGPKSVVSGWERHSHMCIGSMREPFTRFMFCADYVRRHYREPCQGDSGVPHATDYKGTWFLTGIASRREECDQDEGRYERRYGIYTRVSRYYTWINQTTGLL